MDLIESNESTVHNSSLGGAHPHCSPHPPPPPLDTCPQLLGVIGGAFFGSIQVAWYPDPEADARGRIIDRTPVRVLIGEGSSTWPHRGNHDWYLYVHEMHP